MDFESSDEFSLPLIDEERVKLLAQPTLNNYSRIPQNNINYADIFQLDQSQDSSSQEKSNFFSNDNKKSIKQSRQELTLYLKQSMGGLKARKKSIHHQPPVKYMKQVHTISVPTNFSEILKIFLSSNYFIYFIRVIAILNLIGMFITDYSFRAQTIVSNHLSTSNCVALCLQLFANCVFTLQIVMKFYQDEPQLKDPYLFINLGGTIATWCSIFFDMVQYDDNPVFTIFMIARIIRAIIRVMQVFKTVRTPFQIFIKTLPSLQKLFFPLIIIGLFYALTGMALYSGSSYYLCKQEINNVTSYTGYCGASLYECPSGQTCVQVDELPQPAKWNQWNIINFHNIGHALLTVYHFIFNTNFSLTRGKFTQFINPYISTLFFLSMSIFFFYIFANLIMISMSKAYMHQIDTKGSRNEQQYQEASQENSQEKPTLVKVVQILNFLLALAQCVIIAITCGGISQELKNLQSVLDFALSFASLGIIIFLIVLLKKQYFKDALNIIDVGTIFCHLLDLVICGICDQSVIYSEAGHTLVLRSFKALRIIRILYISDKIFTYEKFVIWVFKKTIIKIKSFLLLCLCFAFMFTQIGELLFAFKIRFNSSGEADIFNGTPYINNYESFSSALYSVFYLFLNQNWSATMYQYYAAVGWPAICFFVIVSFILHMMLMRLYIAVFLSYFREELSKKSKQELIRENNQKIESLREAIKEKTIKKSNEGQQQCENSQSSGEVNSCVQQPSGCCAWPILKSLLHSSKFFYLLNGIILIHCLTIVVRSSTDEGSKVLILSAIQNICFAIYMLQVILGCLIDGVYLPSDSYLRRNKSNVISLAVAVIAILTFIPFSNQLVNAYLRRITIIKIFALFRQTDKKMTIVLDTIGEIITKFFKFMLIYALLLFLIAIVPLKLLNNQSGIFNCQLGSIFSTYLPDNETACLALGGTWLRNQNFHNIFSSLALFYQLASSESWSVYITSLIQNKQHFGWQLFFIIIFFVYNICFLNIMMGFIVQTYMHLKDKAYNLNLLKQSQRCWVLIKNSIHCLAPKPILTLSNNCSAQRKMVFELITSESYVILMDYLPYFNAALYVCSYYGQSGFYKDILQYCKNAVMFCFLTDVVLKIFCLRKKYSDLANSYIDFFGGLMIVIHSLASWICDLGYEMQHIMNFFLVFSMLLRCKSLLTKYSWTKTNLNSVIDILPKCGTIIKLVCTLFFFYAAIGQQLFKNVKLGYVVDNYNIGYNNFLTSIITLARITVAQGWYEVVSAFLKQSTPTDFCFPIGDHIQAQLYRGMGCGSWLAYPYFLSFHILMVLLVMNLLIATMASAYDDNYEIQYNSVNIFQLEDCLNLWQKYDPHATGVVHYKKFWRLTSQIAILFGISKKKLIKRKNKFFQELDLQIYQEQHNPILCYRFHDVITKFSKIKLQVANLVSKREQEDSGVQIQFDISATVLKEIKDFITPFPDQLYSNYHPFKQYKSAETKYIFGLLKKLRHWKHMTTERKRLAGGTKLSSIFEIKSKKQSNYTVVEKDQFQVPIDL